MDFIRLFQPGTVDREELLAVLALLLADDPPSSLSIALSPDLPESAAPGVLDLLLSTP
jgi:hypothetical protein